MTEQFPLQNQVVAITGRLISMSHADVADLIATLGGRYVRNVTRATTMLVVGEDGLPLASDGSPDAKLRRVDELTSKSVAIEIVNETEFLRRIHLGEVDGVRRQYTLTELTSIAGVRASLIQSWMRHGLLQPVTEHRGVQYFDFGQVSRLRSLAELASNGISPARLREGLRELAAWLDDDRPLELLTAVSSHRRCLVVRLKDGRLADTRGQLMLDFEEADFVEGIDLLSLPTTPLLERAIEYEEEGELELAATVYREVLQRGDEEPETRFNCANVVYSLGRISEAIELFEQALDRDSEYAEAWNNLGSAYLDEGRHEDALSAFQHAINARSEYADAHFNLATTLDDLNRSDESREHWMAYLKLRDTQRRSNRVRTKRMASRQSPDEGEESMILRFDAHR